MFAVRLCVFQGTLVECCVRAQYIAITVPSCMQLSSAIWNYRFLSRGLGRWNTGLHGHLTLPLGEQPGRQRARQMRKHFGNLPVRRTFFPELPPPQVLPSTQVQKRTPNFVSFLLERNPKLPTLCCPPFVAHCSRHIGHRAVRAVRSPAQPHEHAKAGIAY